MQFSKIRPCLMRFNTLQKQMWEGRGGRRGRVEEGGGGGGGREVGPGVWMYVLCGYFLH